MAKGYSLSIGVNNVDPIHYQGWSGDLEQPCNDVAAVCGKAKRAGFETKTLLTKEATRENVVRGIKEAAQKLDDGDLFFLYYSGHGGQVPDLTGTEKDGLSETWCLHDGQLLDKELYTLWPEFKQGVRVFVVSDSCHSGTVTKMVPDLSGNRLIAKNMPDEYIKKVFDGNQPFYHKIYEDLALLPKRAIQVRVMLIGSCRDDQSSYAFANSDFSLFTDFFKDIGDVTYKDAVKMLRAKIRNRVGTLQTPAIYLVGKRVPFQDEMLLKI